MSHSRSITTSQPNLPGISPETLIKAGFVRGQCLPNSDSYFAYLDSRIWRKKLQAAIFTVNRRCEYCRRLPTRDNPLVGHHLGLQAYLQIPDEVHRRHFKVACLECDEHLHRLEEQGGG
jgi:hypothetical protein